MKVKMIRSFSLVLASIFVLGLFAGCGSNANNNTDSSATIKASTEVQTATEASANQIPKETATINVIMPGDESKRMSEYLDNEFAVKMKKELNDEFSFSYIPWGQYWDKLKLTLASSQPCDFFWEGIGNVSNYQSKQQVMALNDLIDKYGQDLKNVIPAKHFEAASISGKIYSVPSAFTPGADAFNSILVRQDILEKVGMKEIKTIADLEAYAEKAKIQFPDMNVATFFPYDLSNELMRELLDKPYSVLTPLLLVDESSNDSKIYDIIELGLLKKVNEYTTKWREKGWIPEEVLAKFGDGIGRMDSGKYLMTEGAISRPLENILNLKKNVPDGEYAEYLLAPEKPRYIKIPGNQALMISSYSKVADRVIMWINWMYKSQENYDFIVLGVEGKDYKMENGKVVPLTSDTLFYEWMFRNLNYMKFPTTVSDDFINSFKNWDKDAKYSKVFGFMPNNEPVKSEMAKIDTVMTETLYPMILGFAEYDKYIDKLTSDLKAAGLDKVKAEYEKQLSEFMAK